MIRIIMAGNAKEKRQFFDVQHHMYDKRFKARPLPVFEVRRLLDEERNPGFRDKRLCLLVALYSGEPVGRCSLLLPSKPGGTAIFGFFECIDDCYTAHALLERAEEISREHGATAIHGPFSPTYTGVTGVQLDCFGERNILFEACSPPYYAALLETAGYTIERRGRTWRNLSLRRDAASLIAGLPDRSSRYHIRRVGRKDLARGIQDLALVFELAFGESWARDPLTLDEYFYSAEFLLPAFRPESLSLVCDGSQPVGALLCVPDINPALQKADQFGCLPVMVAARQYARLSRTLVTFAMGLLPSHQNSTAALLLSRHFIQSTAHYTELYSTWITEGNIASERVAKRFGLSPWKTFAVYRKEL
jgi:hypothetical protein